MLQPGAGSLMEVQYHEAAQAETREKRLEIARLNLTDPNLSRYFRIKNLLVVVSAADDWHERAKSRCEADKIWRTADRLTDDDNEPAHKALRELRKELDDVGKQLEESAPKDADMSLLAGERDDDAISVDMPSETDGFEDDEAAVLEAEREVFGDDSNIIAMYERAAAAGREARRTRELSEAAAKDKASETLR